MHESARITPMNIDRRLERRQDELLDEAVQLVRRAEVVEACAAGGALRETKEMLALNLRLRASTKVLEALDLQSDRDGNHAPAQGS